jgi:hypothetical protein
MTSPIYNNANMDYYKFFRSKQMAEIDPLSHEYIQYELWMADIETPKISSIENIARELRPFIEEISANLDLNEIIFFTKDAELLLKEEVNANLIEKMEYVIEKFSVKTNSDYYRNLDIFYKKWDTLFNEYDGNIIVKMMINLIGQKYVEMSIRDFERFF